LRPFRSMREAVEVLERHADGLATEPEPRAGVWAPCYLADDALVEAACALIAALSDNGTMADSAALIASAAVRRPSRPGRRPEGGGPTRCATSWAEIRLMGRSTSIRRFGRFMAQVTIPRVGGCGSVSARTVTVGLEETEERVDDLLLQEVLIR